MIPGCHIFTELYIYIYIYLYIYICIDVYVYICMHVCMYVYIYIYIYTLILATLYNLVTLFLTMGATFNTSCQITAPANLLAEILGTFCIGGKSTEYNYLIRSVFRHNPPFFLCRCSMWEDSPVCLLNTNNKPRLPT